uniref:Uncharacterized protein n=1 Tax=Polyblepharides amylifera TaxID=1486889 RepID=A0A7R9SVC2_9CHLO|mmetsp:Transcript_377/g.510  ORF Transcript_377/g.510 Transcript_377/m.510 type:complete len:105 (+) Transcript_377:21-335(+)
MPRHDPSKERNNFFKRYHFLVTFFEMPTATAGMIGGLFVSVFSNGIRKVPLMRHPWEHLLGMGVGYYVFDELNKYEERLKLDVESLVAKRDKSNIKYKELTSQA